MGATYPIITLWQPFATLAVIGRKQNETRPRPFPSARIGKIVAFHAALKVLSPREIGEELHELCLKEFGCAYNYSLPYGSVVGTVRIVDNVRTEERSPLITPDERVTGDWRPGRWAIGLADPQQFDVILPHRGKQGWGTWIDPRSSSR